MIWSPAGNVTLHPAGMLLGVEKFFGAINFYGAEIFFTGKIIWSPAGNVTLHPAGLLLGVEKFFE